MKQFKPAQKSNHGPKLIEPVIVDGKQTLPTSDYCAQYGDVCIIKNETVVLMGNFTMTERDAYMLCEAEEGAKWVCITGDKEAQNEDN